MTRRLVLILTLLLGASCSNAGDVDVNAASTLKADLDTVVATGRVKPVDGVTTAGQPDAAALKVFADNGYVAVIDLRTAGEDRGMDEPAVVAGLGMEYVTLPIGSDGINFGNAKELERLIKSYDQPVLVHCASANRVGALLALNRFMETGNSESALESGRAAGLTRLEGEVRKLIEVE